MATATLAPLDVETVGDLIARLGGIDPARIRWEPIPSTATEQDLIDVLPGFTLSLAELFNDPPDDD